jgi:hypothetical protein
MDAINSVAAAINRTLDTGVAYVTDNALALAVLLAIAYFVRTNGKCSLFSPYGALLHR